MNRPAEQAVPEAVQVFGDAIKAMTVQDATGILTGPPDAATQYFRKTSEEQLRQRFMPIVKQATEKTGVTVAYKNLTAKAGPAAAFLGKDAGDLDGYITQKTLAAAPSAPAPVAAAPAPAPAPAPKVCANCGTVTEIVPIEKKGDSSGAGAVIGGIGGGVLGHQVGGGRGKDVATVAGALGGAFVGNEIEKNKGTTAAWDIRVRLDDGSSKVVRYTTERSWRVGDKVRIENGKLVGG